MENIIIYYSDQRLTKQFIVDFVIPKFENAKAYHFIGINGTSTAGEYIDGKWVEYSFQRIKAIFKIRQW